MNITAALRSAVRGTVHTAEDAGFDRARRPWNLAVEQPALAVVEAADAHDVAAVARLARLHGLSVAAQPSGHGATGNTDGTILLRTGRLDELRVDPERRVARAGAGVRWGRVLAEAGPHGLTGLAGSSPVVTVTGYTLGGGLSWFGRGHGWASDSVRAFDVVTADGEPARVTADSDPELFWALRGGGGDFALVTAVEFDLHPAPVLYGGRMTWSADRAPAVLDAYREVTADAPDELTVWYELLRFPGAPAMVAVDVTFLGEPADAGPILRPFEKVGGPLSDSRAVLPVADLGSITAEPTDPGAGRSRAELLTRLDDEAAAVLLDGPIDPLLSVQLRHLGGALARRHANGGAAGPLTEPHALYMFGLAPSREAEAAVRARQAEIAGALTRHTSGRKPLTFLAPGERAASAFTAPALDRLRDLKRARDPHGVLRSNFPVLA
ncbi:FAD-binding oxidoreductase [Actinomadura kijaniata]|uniref:FAD-binding oxidoreductase n=1 Tax=Actinomadura kijaniata TaxID=46161 RepID=UPI003F194A97